MIVRQTPCVLVLLQAVDLVNQGRLCAWNTTWAVTVQEWAVLPLLAMATESGGLIAGMGTYYGSSRETKSRIVVVRNVRLTRSCF